MAPAWPISYAELAPYYDVAEQLGSAWCGVQRVGKHGRAAIIHGGHHGKRTVEVDAHGQFCLHGIATLQGMARQLYSDIDLAIYDGDPQSAESLLYGDAKLGAAAPGAVPGLRATQQIALGGRTWKIRIARQKAL